MNIIRFYDVKPYDMEFFDKENEKYGFTIKYYEEKLNPETAVFSTKDDVVCAFVNDNLGKETLKVLYKCGVKLIAMRCAGYNNVNLRYMYQKLHLVRVPAYSPYAVAEHAIGMLLSVNRKLYKAYNRTRDFNFNLNGLTGFDLKGKIVGVIGTGRIGSCFINICKGFGMKVVAYDPYPLKDVDYDYVSMDDIFKQSDIISLHCPLSNNNYHLIDKKAIYKMKKGVVIINTSRGALIDTEALVEGLLNRKIGGTCLDVYEEEADMFYEDNSDKIIKDDVLSRLLTLPNVLVTSHQAFLTKEALQSIAETTLNNIAVYSKGEKLVNEVCCH